MMVAVEEKLAQLGATVEAESFALKPFGRAERRRLFTRRMLAAGMAAAVLSAVIGGIVLAAGLRVDRPETVAPSGDLEGYLDKSYGWQMAYPSNWRALEIDDCSTAGWCERGALVSNLDRDVAAKWGILLTDVPSDFVGVKFVYNTYDHLGGLPYEPPDTPFPLSLQSLEHAEDEWPRDRYWSFVVVDDREVFRIDVWIGPDASPDEIDAVEAIIASITEPVHAEELLNLSPGQISEEPIAVFEEALPVVLSPGTYRLSRSFGDAAARLNVSAVFVVEG